MNRKGVSYDVGRVMGGNWHPTFDLKIIHRELEIIKNDLHCNAVRICGLDINRLMKASEVALNQGLEVWLSPEMWNKSQTKTLNYIVRAAAAAENLRGERPEQLFLSVGSELTLFMQGIVPGNTFMKRLRNPSLREIVNAGEHNKPLNAFLAGVKNSVRKVFHGQLTYASLPWEAVDWSLFDFVGVDHYRDAGIEDRYVDMLKPLFAYGKPVIITEFGHNTVRGTTGSGAIGSQMIGNVDYKTLFLHRIPLLGRFVRPRLNGEYVRDEALQARELIKTLGILDATGVDGAFVFTFAFPIYTYDSDPRYDLDMASTSLVKSYGDGKHGATYPDMPWEPKESFRALADYYGTH
ncbi:MAG: abortive infection protein [Halobacteriota archaeon]